MRLAFMGTPEIAATCLRALHAAGHEIAAVYTQPGRPRGRGQAVRPSPVQALAEELGIEVRTPASMKPPEEATGLSGLNVDAAVVVAFGQILPQAVLDAPRLGSFNLHASLLPRWRGAAPIQRAIMAGDAETGVQVMRMTAGLDEGPVLATARTPITAEDTFASVHDRLAELGAMLLVHTLQRLGEEVVEEIPQTEAGLTYAKKITPAEARLDWTRPAAELDAHIRGLSPFPGAWFEVESQKGRLRVKALFSKAANAAGASGAQPGELLDDALTVACGAGPAGATSATGATGAVQLLRLQREGGRPQDAAEFLRGLPLAKGGKLL